MVSLGIGLALTRPRRVFAGGGADFVTDPTFQVGRDTLANAGGQATTDAVAGGFTATPDSAAITGGVDAAHWGVKEGYKLTPSTAGRSAGLLGGPSSDGNYSLTVDYVKDGQTFPHTVTITTVEDEYSVASRAEADAAIADKGAADKGLMGCSGHRIFFASAHGQSNSEGPAAHDGGTTHPSGTFQWFSSAWPGSNVIEEITDTLIQHHNNFETSGNMGPDISFAEQFHANNPNCTLILVGCAKFSTQISLHEKYSEIYEDAVSRLNALTTRHPNFECYGAYWGQGESDGQNGDKNTIQYANVLTKLLNDLRTDIDGWDDTTPIAILGFTPTTTYIDIEAAFPLVAARLGYCELIDNTGATGDSIHFDASGLRVAGVRLANAIDAATAISTPPTIQELTPADGATAVNTNQVLAVDFGVPIQAGTGDITVKNLTDATEEVITLPDSRVTFGGTVLMIRPTSLAVSKDFAVQIDATAVDDIYGNSFAGISDDTTWNFTTNSAAALDPSDWCSGLLDWYDASDDATVTHASNIVSQWDSKGVNANDLNAIGGTPTYDDANDLIDFDADRIGIAAFTGPTGEAVIWAALETGTKTSTQIVFSKTTSASGPYIYMRNDASKHLSAGASTIIAHAAGGSLNHEGFQLSGLFFDAWSDGAPADIILEIHVPSWTGWTGFYVGGMSSFLTDMKLRQVAITEGCVTLEQRANMLAFMQSKIAA